MIRLLAKEKYITVIEIYIKVNLKTQKQTVMANIYTVIVQSFKVYGRTTFWMVLENKHGLMVQNIKAIIKMECEMGKEHI